MRTTPDPDRVQRESRGRSAEHVAAAFLVLRGHRIIERRCRTPHGEIDLIAARGKRIVFVEVKHRQTREAAEAALTARQARRVAEAADYWIGRRPMFAEYERGFDAVLVLPWRWPVLVKDAYQPVGTSGRMW